MAVHHRLYDLNSTSYTFFDTLQLMIKNIPHFFLTSKNVILKAYCLPLFLFLNRTGKYNIRQIIQDKSIDEMKSSAGFLKIYKLKKNKYLWIKNIFFIKQESFVNEWNTRSLTLLQLLVLALCTITVIFIKTKQPYFQILTNWQPAGFLNYSTFQINLSLHCQILWPLLQVTQQVFSQSSFFPKQSKTLSFHSFQT